MCINICGLFGLIGLVLSCLVFVAELHPKSLYKFISHLKCNL